LLLKRMLHAVDFVRGEVLLASTGKTKVGVHMSPAHQNLPDKGVDLIESDSA